MLGDVDVRCRERGASVPSRRRHIDIEMQLRSRSLLARTAIAKGDADEAVRLSTEAAELSTSTDMPELRADALLAKAASLRALGDTDGSGRRGGGGQRRSIEPKATPLGLLALESCWRRRRGLPINAAPIQTFAHDLAASVRPGQALFEPCGTMPNPSYPLCLSVNRAPVAQWIRAADFGSAGRGFESLRARQCPAATVPWWLARDDTWHQQSALGVARLGLRPRSASRGFGPFAVSGRGSNRIERRVAMASR